MIKEFYNYFSTKTDSNGDYINLGTFDEFEKDMQDAPTRKALYDYISSQVDENGDYYNLGTFDEFEKDIVNAKEIGKVSAQATGQATKEQPKVARPVTAVQASDRGPFYTTKAFGDWLNGQPNPQMVEQTKAINQAQASGQVTETPTAPSAPKAEDITTTKATATTAEVPKVETTANPVSALHKADGTPYKAEELQATADKQQAESTAQSSAEIEAEIDEKIANQGYLSTASVEADKARLAEAKAREAEGDQKAEDGESDFISTLQGLYGKKDSTPSELKTYTTNYQLPIDLPTNFDDEYYSRYGEDASRVIFSYAKAKAVEDNGGNPLSDTQLIDLNNRLSRMSEDDVAKLIGEEGMSKLMNLVEKYKSASRGDAVTYGAVDKLFAMPGMSEQISNILLYPGGSGQDESTVKELLKGDVTASTLASQNDYQGLANYINAKVLGVEQYFGKGAVDYYMQNPDTNKDTKSKAILNYANAIKQATGKVNLPQSAEDYLVRNAQDMAKRGQIGTTDGDARMNDMLSHLAEYGELMGMLSGEDKAIVLERANKMKSPYDQIKSIEDACFGGYDLNWNIVKDAIVTLKQQQGVIQSMDDNIAKVEKVREDADGIGEYVLDKAVRAVTGPAYYIVGDVIKDGVHAWTNPDLAFANYAMEYYKDAKDILEDGKDSGFVGFMKGLGNSIATPRVWDFGARDLQMALAIKAISEKWERNEELTEAETMFMDAVATNIAAQALTKQSTAYQVGSNVGGSIPYLIEMALPVKGGKTIASKVYKWAVNRVERGALKNIIKYASKLTGGITEAEIRTATIGVGRVAEGATKRLTPEINLKQNEKGGVAFDGFEAKPDKSVARAIGESAYEKMVEYWVEKAGRDIFKALGVGKARKLANDFLKRKGIEIPKNTDWNAALKAMAYNGSLEEFGEEMLTAILQTPVNETTLDANEKTGVFNADNITMTALTTYTMSALLNAPNVASRNAQQKKFEQQLSIMSDALDGELGESWNDWKSAIDNATYSEVATIMDDIRKDKNLAGNQKELMLRYAVNKNAQRELMSVAESESIKDKTRPSINAQKRIEEAERKGANITDVNEGYNTQIREDITGESLARMVGVESISEAKDVIAQRYGTDSPMEIAIEVANDASLNDTQRKVILDYYTALATNQGKRTALEQKRDINKQTADAVSAKTNKDMNKQVVTATRKADGAQVTIIAGNIVTNEDGSINKEKSDDAIVSVDANGNKDMISLGNISSIATQSKEDAELEERARLTQELEKAENVSNGRVSVGDVIDYGFYDGNTNAKSRKVVVTDVTTDADGNRMVTFVEQELNGAEPVTMTEKELEVGRDIAYKANNGYQIYNGPVGLSNRTEQATQAEPTQEQAPITQVAEQAPQVESAEVVEESTEQTTAIEPGAMVSLADGSIGEVVSMPEDGRVIVEHEDGSTNEYNVGDLKVAEKPSAQTPQAPQAPTAPQVESTPAVEQAESAQQVESTATPTAQVEIPTDEKGKKVYEQAPIDATINDIYNDPELDEEEADAYVQAKIDGTTKRIEAIDKKKPKMGEDRDAYVAERDAWRAERGAEQAKLDYWQGVQAQRAQGKKDTPKSSLRTNEPTGATPSANVSSTPSPKMDTPKAEPTAPPMESKPKAKPIKVGTKRNAKGQVIGLIDSPLAQVLNNTTRRILNKLGESLGVSIHIVPHLEGANAKIEGNRITIAIDAEQGPLKALGHELLHRIKSLSPKAYEDFADVVEKIVPSFQARMVATRLVYSNAGRKIDMKLLREEVVADLAGDVMYHAGLMQKFVEVLRPKNTKEIIMDTMRDLYARIRGVFEGEGARNFAKAERVLLDAMKKANKVVAQDETTEADNATEKLSIIGESGASALDQAEEATIRMDNLAKARKMERFDYPTKSIRMATGWERGADGKWRYEIDDVKLKKTTYENTETTLGELVDNAELFSAYPSLMDLKVVFTDTPNNTLGRTYSQYAEDENGQGAWIPTQISLNNLLVWDDAETESVLAHEIQHAIQSIEGFVNGGDSANKEDYHRLAGEVEARNVQSRMGMTPDQRRATLLAETEDVARKDQIFLMENSGASAMTMNEVKADIEKAVGGEMEVDGESVPTRFSIRSVVEGGGLTTTQTTTEMIDVDEVGAEMFDIDRHMTDEDGNVIFTIGDKVFSGHNPVSVQDLKETESALSMMVEDAVEYGTITKQRANEIFKTYADIINMYLTNGLAENGGYANLADKWLWVGETAYKTVSKNADDQYLTSLDITRVCKKNEAIIRAISEMQKRLGYGITPAQIMDLYLESNKQGYQVPCPVCYVFSRYLRNGRYATAIINGMKKYGKHLPGQAEEWTAQQWAKELEKQEAIKKNTESVINLTNADIAKLLNEIDDLGEKLMKGNLTKKEETLIKKQILAKDAQYRAALNVESQRALTNWIKSFAIRKSKNEWVLHEDAQLPTDMKDFEEHALDLRKSAEAMRRYPGIQRLRNSGGSTSGKEVTFEGNNDLGEVISAVGKSSPEKAKNVYQEVLSAKTPEAKAKARQEAKNRFAEAVTYAQQQSLRGGQRMWSWSDNIEALSPDVAVNLIQMELLGGAVQTYSKQLEGINLVARMGAYVNGSLMAKDAGYAVVDDADIEIVDGKPVLKTAITETINEPTTEGVVQRTRTLAPKNSPIHVIDGVNYVLIFDDIVGIDPFGRDVNGKHMKGLFELNNELDKAGNIMVGMNDTHIKTAMADDRVFFIIPWHASGQSTHILKQMLNILGAKFEESDATDYTDMQSDKWSFAKGVPSKLIEMWNDTQFTNKECAFGGIETKEGGLTKQQVAYRELRNKMFSGAELSKADLKHIKEDMFLSQVYEKLENRGLKEMTAKDKEHIYPYEYWDESSTYDNADVNGERYIEYCRRLGVRPKFSGKWGSEWSNTGDFTKDKGYWKLLIDRRMYDTKGEYQDLTAIDSKGFSTKLVDPEWTKQQFVVTKVADEQGTMSIVDAVIETEESRTGTIPQTNYELDMGKAVKDYQKARSNAEKLSDTKYSLRGTTPFYSNAERAVENVKQGKATPKAMATDAVMKALEKSGIEVVKVSDTEAEEMLRLGGMEKHIVYHGSGAKFDAFDHSHMGEGEGAQAYGWGTYVTESEGVGREYGKVASYRSGNGRFLYTVEIPDDANNAYIPFDEVVPDYVKNKVKDAIDFLLDTNHMANWYAENMEMDNTYKVFSPRMTGEMLYKTVSKYLVGDERASKFLNDLGFVGIKFPTNYLHGGNAEGQNNYLIFNERDAKIIDRVEFLKTPQGEVYGWTDGKKVYLTEKGMNPETPIHEYTHIWARAMKAKNAKGWQSVKDLLRDTPMWNEVMNDANYADIRENEDAVASEVLSRISGKENAERMMQEAQKMIDNAKGVFEKADAVTLVDRMRRALNEFWSWVGKNLFGIEKFNSIEEVTDRVLYDLVNNTELGTTEGMIEKQVAEQADTKFSLRVGGVLHPQGDDYDGTRKKYNDKVKSFGYKMREGYQDSMLALKELQKIVAEANGKKVEDIPSWQNAYIEENLMSSKNKAQHDAYVRDYYKPLINVVKKLIKKGGMKYDDIKQYLIAKHGLERNEKMAIQEAKKVADNAIYKREQDAKNWARIKANQAVEGVDFVDDVARNEAWKQVFDEVYKRETFTSEEEKQATWEEVFNKQMKQNRNRDYSGLTAMFGVENVHEAEKMARELVDKVEQPTGKMDELWNAIRSATEETLATQYKAGLLSRDEFEKIRDMYEYYVPLRGFDEKTADEEYEYLMNKKPILQAMNAKAMGRSSLADDPLATIGAMADSAIIQSNRNKMKQAFYHFVKNNPSALVTESEQWYVQDGNGRWVATQPDIPANATSADIEEAIAEHEERMEALKKEGKARTKPNTLDTNFITLPGQAVEHMVKLKINGKEKVLYINGNPRAAQAVNGLTNPEAFNDVIRDFGKVVNNYMAQVFTSKNPAFIFTNGARDLQWAANAVMVKEGWKYQKQYAKNIGKASQVAKYILKYNNGTLELDDETQRYFNEFISSGGETGYTAINQLDHYKKEIAKMIKGVSKVNPMTAVNGVLDSIEYLNRSVEDITRFAVFMTSRQMGRSLQQSAYDAKEITVNFNKKGSGIMGARYLGAFYIFLNASLQSINNLCRIVKHHPIKATIKFAEIGAVAYALPVLNELLIEARGDDDDKEAYANLPEWVKKNNVVVYIPGTDGMFFTIPMSHEMRPFATIGYVAHKVMNEGYDAKEGMKDIISAFGDMLPIEIAGNDGNMAVNLTPTFLQPIAQLIANTDYFGKPIYRDADYTELKPEYTTAFRGTSPILINASKYINEISGGDAGAKGKADGMITNPDVLEHLIESYFGGLGKLVNKGVKSISAIWDEQLREVRNIPVVSSFVAGSEERTSTGFKQSEEYYALIDEYKKYESKRSSYEEEVLKGARPNATTEEIMNSLEYANKLTELMTSPEAKRYITIKGYKNYVDALNKGLENVNITRRADVEKMLNELKKELISEVDKAENKDVEELTKRNEKFKNDAKKILKDADPRTGLAQDEAYLTNSQMVKDLNEAVRKNNVGAFREWVDKFIKDKHK